MMNSTDDPSLLTIARGEFGSDCDDGDDDVEGPPETSAAARVGCSHMPLPPGSDSGAAPEVE